MKPYCFTYGENPKPVYLFSEIKRNYNNLSPEEIFEKIKNVWSINENIIILNDEIESLQHFKNQITEPEMENILEKLINLQNQL